MSNPDLHFVPETARALEASRLQAQTRRHFLGSCASGMGAMFLATSQAEAAVLAAASGDARLDFTRDPSHPLAPLPPQFAPKARRVIFLHMVGGPSQLELFEH